MMQLLQAPVSRYGRSENALATNAGVTGTGTDLLIGTHPCADEGLVQVLTEDRSDGRLTLRFDAPTDGIVFVSEAFYPERRAYVDGRRVQTHKANVAFTAIRVPSGRHQLDLQFVPVSFYAGAGLSAATICAWAVGVYRTRQRSA
jgi:hypothetical protein